MFKFSLQMVFKLMQINLDCSMILYWNSTKQRAHSSNWYIHVEDQSGTDSTLLSMFRAII